MKKCIIYICVKIINITFTILCTCENVHMCAYVLQYVAAWLAYVHFYTEK